MDIKKEVLDDLIANTEEWKFCGSYFEKAGSSHKSILVHTYAIKFKECSACVHDEWLQGVEIDIVKDLLKIANDRPSHKKAEEIVRELLNIKENDG